jgi:hypothetical protein
MSYRKIVVELNRRGVRKMRGGAWTANTILNVLRRDVA